MHSRPGTSQTRSGGPLEAGMPDAFTESQVGALPMNLGTDPTWDLESSLRGRRLKWAGQILNGETRWLQQTVEHMAMRIISDEKSATSSLPLSVIGV